MAADDTNWYVLRVISGKETKVKEYLDMEMARSGWDEIVTQILVPKEKVYKLRAGKKVIQEKERWLSHLVTAAIAANPGCRLQGVAKTSPKVMMISSPGS